MYHHGTCTYGVLELSVLNISIWNLKSIFKRNIIQNYQIVRGS